MPQLVDASLRSVNSAGLGPGVLVKNLIDFSLQGVLDVLNNDESKGLRLGAMTAAPSISISRDTLDITENLVGLNAPLKGATQIQRTDVTMDCELAELTHRNWNIIHPGSTQSDWTNGVPASLLVGTGNSALKLTHRTAGVAGNSVNFVISTPAGSTTTVTVATSTITVAPKTGALASEVIAAINSSVAVRAMTGGGVQAGLPSTSDGTGVIAAFTSAPLAGGTAGTKVGSIHTPTGFISTSDYMDNICLVLEGVNAKVLQIWRINNAVMNDDISIDPDDSGAISGISCTFAGHVSDVDKDPNTGIFLPPYKFYNLDTPVAA